MRSGHGDKKSWSWGWQPYISKNKTWKGKHNSVNDIRLEKEKHFRLLNGLAETPQDINAHKITVGSGYVESPKHKTRTDLSEYRKRKMLDDMDASNNYQCFA